MKPEEFSRDPSSADTSHFKKETHGSTSYTVTRTGLPIFFCFNISSALISLFLDDVSIIKYGFLVDCVLVVYLFKSRLLQILTLLFGLLLLILLQQMHQSVQMVVPPTISRHTKTLDHWVPYLIASLFIFAIAHLYKNKLDSAFRLRVHTELKGIAANNEKELKKLKDLQLYITHDIRGAYAGVATICSMICEMVSAKKEITNQIAQRLVAASENYKNILTDILELSKYWTGNSEDIIYSNVTIRQEINKIILSHSVISDERNIKTVIEIQSDFPNVVFTDRIKVYRIVNNIYSNALKFTRDDSSIVISLSHSPSSWDLTISDQGEGLQPGEIDKLFKPYTTERSARNREGNGLGLYITKLLLEVLDGVITVESKVGEGTSFKVVFPMKKVNSNYLIMKNVRSQYD